MEVRRIKRRLVEEGGEERESARGGRWCLGAVMKRKRESAVRRKSGKLADFVS